jgi:2-iminobutanoate/2-iminopropanoate deaminase
MRLNSIFAKQHIKILKSMAKKVIYSTQAPEPIGPYSQAVRAGNLVFLSGQIAIQQATGKLITANIEDETKQVMENLSEILKAAGTDFANVVKCTIFLTDMNKCTIFLKDMNNFPKVNEIYGQYFSTEPPARETVEVSRLPKDVNVEISCVALIP